MPNPNGDPVEQVRVRLKCRNLKIEINNVADTISKAGISFGAFDDTFYVAVEPGSWPQNKTANQEFLIKMIQTVMVKLGYV